MNCYFCGKEIFPRFCFCKQCAKEHGLLKPLDEWPEVYRELKRSLDKEYKQDIRFEERVCDLEMDEFGEETIWAQEQSYNEWLRPKEKTVVDLLEEYNITEDEYDIITTDDISMLAESLGISYEAIHKRKQRLRKRLRIEHPEHGGMNIKPMGSE